MQSPEGFRFEPNPPELHHLFGEDHQWLWPDEDESLAGDLPTLLDLDNHVLPAVSLRIAKLGEEEAVVPSVCVQAGGAIGAWPKRLSMFFDHVYTFEPYPPSFRCLAHNAPELNVHKYNAALGAKHGTATMDFPEHRARSATGKENIGGFRVVGEGDVPVLTIDDLYLNARVDLIMLDLEGFEKFALEGASRTIDEYRPIVVLEDKPGCCETFGYKVGDCEKMLISQFGYRSARRFHGNRDVMVLP